MSNSNQLKVTKYTAFTFLAVLFVLSLVLISIPHALDARETPDPKDRQSTTELDPETNPPEEESVNTDDDENGDTGDDNEDSTTGDDGGGAEDGEVENKEEDTATDDETENNSLTSPTAGTVTVSVRNASELVFSGNYEFIEGETVDVTSSDGAHTIAVDSTSALVALTELDDASDIFTITDLQYYESFGSFFLNCIEVSGEELCGSWQYTVNGDYPSVGLDQYTLLDSDNLFMFFGSPRIVVSPSEVTVEETFVAAAQEFNTKTGLYEAITGYTIGVIQDNPNDPWNPTEIATQTVDSSGEASFTLTATGTYKLGLQEDYYYPTVSLTVIEEETDASTPSENTGGGGGSYTPTFDVEEALAFLAVQQQTDGSFGAPLYSDWAAIALTADNSETAARNSVKDHIIDTDSNYSHVTDHERRAMALMALGISPYDGTRINHIAAILETFDGTQVGNANFINDDIFALIVLRSAGYDAGDTEIEAIRDEVLAAQKTDGSWDGTVDMTAAAIQSLEGLSGVSGALTDARAYLKSKQGSDAGFGNSFSTSWAIMAIVALGEDPKDWSVTGDDPLEYLARAQESDGGVDDTSTPSQNRIWATSYAIPAALELTWIDLMTEFTKQEPENTSSPNSGSDSGDTDEETTAEEPGAATTDEPEPSTELSSADAESTMPPAPQVRGARADSPRTTPYTNPNSAFAFVSDNEDTPKPQEVPENDSEPVSATKDTDTTPTPANEDNNQIPNTAIIFLGLIILVAGGFVFFKK